MNERVIETLTELTAINSPSGSAERAIDSGNTCFRY